MPEEKSKEEILKEIDEALALQGIQGVKSYTLGSKQVAYRTITEQLRLRAAFAAANDPEADHCFFGTSAVRFDRR